MFLIIFLLTPIASIMISSLRFDVSVWEHLISTKLSLYIVNTLKLLIGVAIISVLLGVSTAWIISRYEIKYSKIFEWALILPLAIPAYIVAYCYTDFFDYSGFVQTFIREILGYESSSEYYFPEIRSMGGAIIVMSFVLYPYVYLISKLSFLSTPISLYEIATIHGKSIFFKVALPLARPGIIAGLSLVLMETISDFGTVEFFAIETLTLGIFNLWLGMNNFAAASQVALVSFTFILFLLCIEIIARRRQRFHNIGNNNNKIKKIKLNNIQHFFALLFCLIPILFGFFLPVIILVEQSLGNLNYQNFITLLQVSTNTLFLASVSSIVIVTISLILSLTVRYRGNNSLSLLSTAAGSGYAFPGVMLALGCTYFFGYIQNFSIFNDISFIGSFIAIVTAYVSRFNAIGYGSIYTGVSRVSPNLLEASITLGYSYEKSIKKVILPIIKPSILVACILSFVEIAKELPITLLLRPFNFETLSTTVYQYAKEEMFEDSSLAALSIVLIGLIPIFFLNSILKPEKLLNK